MTKGSLFALLYANHWEIYMYRSVFLSRMISSYPDWCPTWHIAKGALELLIFPPYISRDKIYCFVCVVHMHSTKVCFVQKPKEEDYIFTYLFQTCVREKKKKRGSRYESAWICKVKTTVKIHSLQKGSHWKGSNHSQDSCRRNKNQGCKHSAACGDSLVTSVQCLYLG